MRTANEVRRDAEEAMKRIRTQRIGKILEEVDASFQKCIDNIEEVDKLSATASCPKIYSESVIRILKTYGYTVTFHYCFDGYDDIEESYIVVEA